MPEGLYDSWWPREVPVWINVTPYAEFTQEVYIKELGEVVQVTTPWYQYNKHWVPSIRRQFNCSAGPHRKEPCYGCAVRQMHWDEVAEIEEETGVRPEKYAPVGQMTNYGMSIVIMETVYAVPKTDERGKPVKSKRNKQIINYIEEPMLEEDGDFPEQFGRKAHWSTTLTERETLEAWDEELQTKCGSCAGTLYAVSAVCPDCEELIEFDEDLEGEDITQYRAKAHKCPSCGYKGDEWVLLHECSDCDEPTVGGLTKFDIRIKFKEVGGKKQLRLTDIRIPSEDEDVQKLIQHPLELDKIFRPTDLDYQKRLLGRMVKDVDPSHGAWEESYSDDSGEITY